MDERDLALRNLTYRRFVELGRAPTAEEISLDAVLPVDQVGAGWERLGRQHALVLGPGRRELLMANPFSAVPTPHRVFTETRWWYANCAWDAFGVCAALHADGLVATTCPDCGDHIEIEVREQRPDDPSLRFHCLVPARHWWDDIAFT